MSSSNCHYFDLVFDDHVSDVVEPDWLATDRTKHYIARLRSEGIKSAIDEDGWVNRSHNICYFVKPIFNDGAKAGDLVAIGDPTYSTEPQCHRIVKLIRFIGHYVKENGKMKIIGYWEFEEIRNLIPKKKSWWHWFCH